MNNNYSLTGLSPKRLVLVTVSLSLGAVLGVLSSLNPSVAQLNDPQLFEDYQSNEYDSSGSDRLGNLNPMDLYHQINLNRGRNLDEFRQDSQQDIKDAANEFKRQWEVEQIEEQTTTDNF